MNGMLFLTYTWMPWYQKSEEVTQLAKSFIFSRNCCFLLENPGYWKTNDLALISVSLINAYEKKYIYSYYWDPIWKYGAVNIEKKWKYGKYFILTVRNQINQSGIMEEPPGHFLLEKKI